MTRAARKLELVFDSVVPAPAPPIPESEEVWRDETGRVCAVAWEDRAAACWVRLPGVGRFRFQRGSRAIQALPESEASRPRVRDAFDRIVLPLVLHAQGDELLHASAVRTEAGVLAFCATSGTGKSTLARFLAMRGYAQWADDMVVIRPSAARTVAIPIPYHVRLRDDARAALERLEGDSEAGLPDPDERAPSPLAAVAVLARDEDASPTVRRLPPVEGFFAVLPHAHFFTLRDADRRRSMMERYFDLATTTPIFELRFRSGFAGLPEVQAALERALAEG